MGHNQKVNFNKISKKVHKSMKDATKQLNGKTERKLINAVNELNGVKGGKSGNKILTSSKLIKIIRNSIRQFRANVSITLSFKKNKKMFLRKKKQLKKQYLSARKSIGDFIKSFGKNLKTLENTEKTFSKKIGLLKNNGSLKNLLKIISRTINKIKMEAKEAKEALGALKRLYLSVR